MTQVIRNRQTDDVIYSSGDATMKETVERAVREGVDLSNANLMNYDFTGANFSNGKFEGANFAPAKFGLVNFSQADLRNTNFIGSSIQNSIFYNADLSDSEFSWFYFEMSRLDGAIFNNTKMSTSDHKIIFNKAPIIIQLNDESSPHTLFKSFEDKEGNFTLSKHTSKGNKRRVIYIFENYMEVRSHTAPSGITLSLNQWKTTPPSKIFPKFSLKNDKGDFVNDNSNYIWWKANKSWILKMAQLNGCSFEGVKNV